MGNVKKFTWQIIDKVKVQRPAAKNAFARPEPPAKEAKGKRKTAADSGGEAGAAAASKRVRAASPAPAKASASVPSSDAAKPAQPITIGSCPNPGCGGHIFMGRKGYGCSNYKTGCGFVIWKESFDRMLTDTMVKSLVEKGKTAKLKFGKAEEEAYEARIVLKNEATGELALERT
jgi:DNA topoisomerase-3